MNYSDRIEIRDIAVDGETNWTWIKSDHGAWYGPKLEWESSHKPTYLKYLKERKSVITAGGNCGMYVRHYAKLFDVVWAFEPSPVNFHCMVNNSTFTNVVKIQAALGDVHKMIAMNDGDQNNVGVHTVDPNRVDSFIPMLTIDSFNFPHCSLIQLDVEDYEPFVIKGALDTIKKFRPVVIMEKGDKQELQDMLRPLNYDLVDRTGSDHVWVPKE